MLHSTVCSSDHLLDICSVLIAVLFPGHGRDKVGEVMSSIGPTSVGERVRLFCSAELFFRSYHISVSSYIYFLVIFLLPFYSIFICNPILLYSFKNFSIDAYLFTRHISMLYQEAILVCVKQKIN